MISKRCSVFAVCCACIAFSATAFFDFIPNLLLITRTGRALTAKENNVPQVAWLLSFPSSGTDYTLSLALGATQTAVAENYESTHKHKESKQVYKDRVNGPFRISDLKLPEKYILTKTHCTYFQFELLPHLYVSRGKIRFFEGCLSGSRLTNEGSVIKTKYDSKLVGKAVHLIRDPLSNIVSRFLKHDTWNNLETKFPREKYPRDKEGFQAYCKDLDDMMYHEEKKWFLSDPKMAEAMEGVPCRSEFFKYFQWHNLALDTTREIHKVPTLIIHYSDFSKHFSATLYTLLQFLELDRAPTEYIPVLSYKTFLPFYEVEQRAAVVKLANYMASPELKVEISQYW